MKTTTKIIGIAIILMMVAIVSVSALDDPKVPGFTNQYVAINITSDVSTTGQFFGHIRAATNVFSNEVVVIGPSGQKNVPVNPDGTFEVTNLVPGKYTVYLLDGNGGQFEQSSFTVNAAGISHLDNEILGHAFSAQDAGKQPDVIVVSLATYGNQYTIPGTYVTVTQQVQSVIDQGHRSFFLFNNAQNPGGIFGQGNVLLAQIIDPAPGQVKKVHIEYTLNGVNKVIDANEYDVITI